VRFEFATAGRIVFGPGTIAELPAAARNLGTRVLVVTGRDDGRWAAHLDALSAAGLTCATYPTPGEPTIDLVRTGVARAREHGADLVVAIGGGSAIDASKAIAALATNPGDALDYLEVVGKGQPLAVAPLPVIAVPTTAGTGAEVTRNAVIGVPERRVKVSLRSALMLPRVAIVDPDLTLDLPPVVTAFTGLDALTQLIEPYVSSRANPLVDALCLEGLRRAAGAIRRVYHDGSDRDAREAMSLASLFGGLALANAGLGAVHGLAGPIGGRVRAPHGAICAALLPHVTAVNLHALETRAPDHPARQRYDVIARILTGRGDATAADVVDWLRALIVELDIPSLATYGLGAEDVDILVEQAQRASSMKANPIVLTAGELREVLEKAMAMK
jgi:alcohol dehydrogenase class IV